MLDLLTTTQITIPEVLILQQMVIQRTIQEGLRLQLDPTQIEITLTQIQILTLPTEIQRLQLEEVLQVQTIHQIEVLL